MPAGGWADNANAEALKLPRTAIIAVILASVLGAGCVGTDGEQPVAAAPTTANTSTTLADEFSSVVEVMEHLQGYVADWNANQLDWLVAYQDPDVRQAEFIEIQQTVLLAQARTVVSMELEISDLPVHLHDAFLPFVENFGLRLDQLGPLFGAAATGTDQEFEAALAGYQDVVGQIITAVEHLFAAPAIETLLQAEGTSAEQFVAAFRQVVSPETSADSPAPTTTPPVDYLALRDRQHGEFFAALGLVESALDIPTWSVLITNGYMLASSETPSWVRDGVLRRLAESHGHELTLAVADASQYLDSELAAGWVERCAEDDRVPPEMLGGCAFSVAMDNHNLRSLGMKPIRQGSLNPAVGPWWCEAAKFGLAEGLSAAQFIDRFKRALGNGETMFPAIAAKVDREARQATSFSDLNISAHWAYLPYPSKPDDVPIEELWYPYSVEDAASHAAYWPETECVYAYVDVGDYPSIPDYIADIAVELAK